MVVLVSEKRIFGPDVNSLNAKNFDNNAPLYGGTVKKKDDFL
jgi:hypothetical protein